MNHSLKKFTLVSVELPLENAIALEREITDLEETLNDVLGGGYELPKVLQELAEELMLIEQNSKHL